ncbi:hypothetical protein C2E23DRAFT_40066 [Lenzites betulinus]|nr:hypothetical protein C2E23DRAFT_40066 [Lenzites betulinus]
MMQRSCRGGEGRENFRRTALRGMSWRLLQRDGCAARTTTLFFLEPPLHSSVTIYQAMDSLPLETLEHIFELACVDGGYTGCSLSLTSRAIRVASRTARYHSVALPVAIDDTPSDLTLFLPVYQEHYQKQHGDRPRIRHLHVHLTADPFNQLTVVSDNSLRNLRTLFQAVAGDIHTLSIHVVRQLPVEHPNELSMGIINHPFPSLRELTILGVRSPKILVAAPDGMGQPMFPALERFHMIDLVHRNVGEAETPPSQDFDEWMAHVPRATHLRISNLYWDSLNVVEQLAASMGYNMHEPDLENRPRVRGRGAVGPWQPLRHPHLRFIAIQPCRPPSRRDPNVYVPQLYSLFVQQIQILRAFPREPGLQMVMVPAATTGSAIRLAELARKQFVDRIEGGPGCWSIFADENRRSNVS